MKKINLIIGGGMAGLIAAKKLVNQNKKNIVLVEAANQLGGLLKSHHYNHQGAYDLGTHYFTNIYGEEIKTILKSTLNEVEWAIHHGVRSDLSGVFHNGVWNLDTVFVSLFSYDKRKRDNYKKLIQSHINFKRKKDQDPITSHDYLNNIYGSTITTEIFEPILEKLSGHGGKNLHPFAAQLYPLNRMVLFNEEDALENLDKPINQVAAFPSQLDLPSQFHPTYYSYYPKERGIGKVIDALEAELEKSGVQILKNTKVNSLKFGTKIETAMISGVKHQIEKVYSTLPIFGLSSLLGINVDYSSLDSPRHTVLSHLKLTTDFDFNQRHYMYCYDKGFNTFRITNYNAITLLDENPLPITLESSFKEIPSIKEANQKIISELIQLQIIHKESQVKFIHSEILPNGFPLLTKTNMDYIDKKRNEIKSLKISNLISLGVFSDNNIFFMRDVLRKINNLVK